MTAPLRLAQSHHAGLAKRLGAYEVVRESKSMPLAQFRQERFFVNPGDCFAILSETSGAASRPQLSYAIQEQGTPDPSRKKPSPEPNSGGVDVQAELSPEYCPWEPVYLVVSWLTPSTSAAGKVSVHLLRRPHPDPARLARQRPPPSAPPAGYRGGGGGNCSSYECGEDCRSELSACKLDCFRHGRHEMGSQRLCEASCNQAERSCERGCRIPCP